MANTSIDLTLSGLLHEGNFREWKERMAATLRVMKLHPDLLTKNISSTSSDLFKEDAEQEIHLITFQIEPTVFDRIYKEDFKDPKYLMAVLEGLCSPFRLLGLPAELRNRVYERVIRDHLASTVRITDKTMDPLPAIIQASRQLRQESTPLFFARAKFTIHCHRWSPLLDRGRSSEIVPRLRAWIVLMPPIGLNSLRSITMHIRIKDRIRNAPMRELTLFFSREAGLSMAPPPKLTTDSKLALDEHVATVEENRKALSMQGESIVLALISNPRLWEYGTLESL